MAVQKNNAFAVSVLIFLLPIAASVLLPEVPSLPLWLLFLSTFMLGFIVSVGLSTYFSNFFAGVLLFLATFLIAIMVMPISGGLEAPGSEDYDKVIFILSLTAGANSGAWMKRGLVESFLS